MNHEQSRLDLIQSYKAYCAAIDGKGLMYDPIPDDQLDKLTDVDLKVLVRHARDIARTPTE